MSLNVSGRFAVEAFFVGFVEIDLLRVRGLEFLAASTGTQALYLRPVLAGKLRFTFLHWWGQVPLLVNNHGLPSRLQSRQAMILLNFKAGMSRAIPLRLL